MSYSSLCVMDKEFMGYKEEDFENSHLFSPIIWDVLLDKYLPERRLVLSDGKRAGFISSFIADKTLDSDLNFRLDNSSIFFDRILWELSEGRIFFTKNKMVVADSIRKFLNENTKYDLSYSDGISSLQREHIIERFNEIADSIENLNEDEYPYFIFKNTSCDDNVERWFSVYDDETKEYVPRSLKDCDKYVTEFIVIDGENIKFISNTEYFKEESEV